MNKEPRKEFLNIFLSNMQISVELYIEDHFVFNFKQDGNYYCLMSPKTKNNYDKYLETLKLEKPLLFELR